MVYQQESARKADEMLANFFVIGCFLGIASLVLCFWPEPNRYWFLILGGVGLLLMVLCVVTGLRFDAVIENLRHGQTHAEEKLKEMTAKWETAYMFIREFPAEHAFVHHRLEEAGRTLRTAYSNKALLLEAGLKISHGSGPEAVEEAEAKLMGYLRSCDDAIARSKTELKRLHECAKASRADVRAMSDYTWPTTEAERAYADAEESARNGAMGPGAP